MKNFRVSLLGLFVSLTILLFSCNDDAESIIQEGDPLAITDEVMQQFKELGFDPSDMRSEFTEDVITGESSPVYIVENDIRISPSELKIMLEDYSKGKPITEQYRTTNLVSAPRTISVLGYYSTSGSSSSYLDATMRSGLELAIENYNELNLGIQFTLGFGTNSSAYDIVVKRVSGNGGGQAGFPTGGNPYGSVIIQSGTSNYGLNVVEHVLTHELGHCVGFRHTDYFNRAISCGSGGNEGSAGVGAINIPGTPGTTNVDLNSIMLACFNANQSGEFSAYDKTALNTLYPGNSVPSDPQLTVSTSSLYRAYNSPSTTVNVSSNLSWTVSDNASWLSVSPTSGSNNGSFTVSTFSYNQPCEPARTATITVRGGSITRTITVRQTSRPLRRGEQCP
ncbi:M57 family metalloprotease [Fulvivirga sediminis]|uniref:Peptidase n=1 Tax=Fulvivirga sediminis TaxID=2803949 RepID=A0A937F631_9BACT|nr:M57 family metalloprotease [Fulvivirga sediminis]MBL3657107.1 peptidase [Fulvivirga sediminis]